MKRFLITSLIALAVSSVHAAAASWNTGMASDNFLGPDGKSMYNVSGYTVTVTFFSDAGGTTKITESSQTVAKPNGAYNTKTADVFSNTTDDKTFVYYAQAIITGFDGTDNWTRSSGIESFTTKKSGDSTLNFMTGAGFDTETMKWGDWTKGSAPIPEPTSGMLLLIGMAGLMLRRKRV